MKTPGFFSLNLEMMSHLSPQLEVLAPHQAF
uniref:Uncharacterized protein n=1 Tax=Arundo donax TaxID=35708 RepID=A0A0A9GSK6_ARUDO